MYHLMKRIYLWSVIYSEDDEKIQRKIVSALELETVDFTVIIYMMTNKLFSSKYKKFDFPIISYPNYC